MWKNHERMVFIPYRISDDVICKGQKIARLKVLRERTDAVLTKVKG